MEGKTIGEKLCQYRLVLRGLAVGLLLVSLGTGALVKQGWAQSFTASELDFNGKTSLNNPTTLQWGPDDKLYVAEQKGGIKVLTVTQSSGTYVVTGVETIDLVQQLPNHNDDGSENPKVSGRQITGLLVTGSADAPVLYVSSSDPRIGAGSGSDNAELPLDTNSGIISKLSKTSSGWQKVDLVRGLPRSEENHSSNGMQLVGSTLYLAQGGNTNAGSPSENLGYTTEYALSGAVLSIDLAAIEAMPLQNSSGKHPYKYTLPTLDDPDRNNVSNTSGATDPNDPWGGNDGLNQAKLVENGPVQVYSPGYRNPYDVVVTKANQMYIVDNGANAGWGGWPMNEGSGGSCTNQFRPEQYKEVSNKDNLHLVKKGFYGGHPNPVRANPEGAGVYLRDPSDTEGTWTNDSSQLPSDWPPVPPNLANPGECDFLTPGQEDGALHVWDASTNGITEYTASNFNGDMQGNLLAASMDGNVYRVGLNSSGTAVTQVNSIATFYQDADGPKPMPLDVTAQDDNGQFPGTIWIAIYAFGDKDNIAILTPSGSGSCEAADSYSQDNDSDGYSNADEYDNNTNPCSSASKPSDYDDDLVSDLNDEDDDNDGILDTVDRFAVDAQNGTGTSLPVYHPMEIGEPGTGIFGVGFTGLMTNGTDYLKLFEDDNQIAGGIGGLFTIQEVGQGTALNNNQKEAFQFGVNITANTDPFIVKAGLKNPFSTEQPPSNYQSQGIYIGTGDQKNYLSIAVNSNDGQGGIKVVYETDDAVALERQHKADGILSETQLTLHLTVDPAAGTVQPAFQLGSGPVTEVGDPVALEGALLKAVQGNYTLEGKTSAMAIGVLATAYQSGSSFSADWDYITAAPVASAADALLEIVPWGKLDKSTYNPEAFQLTNRSPEGTNIKRVTLDLSTSLFPDVVFDPLGEAGDATGKCLEPDAEKTSQTGYLAPSDNCGEMPNGPYSGAHEGGYDQVTMDFEHFEPGETFSFALDVDPTSIKGYDNTPSEKSAGHISGLELTGATITIEFNNGATLHSSVYDLFHSYQGKGDGYAVVKKDPPERPSIEATSVSTSSWTTGDGKEFSAATVDADKQTIRVNGPAGANVRLLQVDSRLYIEPGTPNGGFDLEEPYEANSAVEVTEYTATINSSGYVDIPVKLLYTSVTEDDGPDGGLNYFVAVVEDKDGSHRLSRTSNPLVLKLNAKPPFVASYQIGWNLMGLPLAVQDSSYKTVFPEATDQSLYSFNNGYVTEETLSRGKGYWLHFGESGQQTVEGKAVSKLSVNLVSGWNLIGGVSCSVSTDAINDPDSIVVTETVYGFDGAYAKASSIKQGGGYWVYAQKNGTIGLDCSKAGTSKRPLTVEQDKRALEAFSQLTVSDRSGISRKLYFNGQLPAGDKLLYALPPLPPKGAADVRFSNNSLLEEGSSGQVQLQALTYPVTIRLERGDKPVIVEALNRENKVVSSHYLMVGGSAQVDDRQAHRLHVKEVSGGELPDKFVLHGNYPNPFNPSTTIAFDLPEQSAVTLQVVDMLGRRVMEVQEEAMAPGSRAIQINASQLSSGIYFYRVTAEMASETVAQTGRMTLVK